MSAFLCAATVKAGGPRLESSEIPQTVLAALKGKFPGAKIDKCERETEHSRLVYDIEFTQNGRKAEADITGDGAIQNFEEALSSQELPDAVTDVIRRKFPGSKMKEVMKVTEVKGGRETDAGFEINLVTAQDKKLEITVARDGRVLEGPKSD